MTNYFRGAWAVILFLLASAAGARAQSLDLPAAIEPVQKQAPAPAPVDEVATDTLPTQSLHYGVWELGGLFGGGLGMGHDSNTSFVFAGVRLGRVLTDDHGPRGLRGNFEFLGEFRPLYMVRTPEIGNVYGAHVMPIILRWNFKGWHRVSPYGQLAGGILFTNHRVPPGDTSSVNFTPQGAAGINIFTKPGQSVAIELIEVHHSNANLGNINPGYNAGVQFTIAYMWQHGWRK